MTGEFNLIDEPWILVVDSAGRVSERSIRDVLCNAGTYVSIGGDIPTQQFATIRLLLAIVRRAVQWDEEPVERWRSLWEKRSLPIDEIENYLNSVRSRFDLLSPSEPFYQVATFATGNNEMKPITLLISDVPAKFQYFTTRAGSGATDLSLAEAARWIVHTQSYDTSGIKTGDSTDPRTRGGKGYPIGIAWAGQLGGVLLEGKTLLETLLLNTVLLHNAQPTLAADDLPVWEKPHLTALARDSPRPSGPTDLLTWQSRRICVGFDNGRANGVIVGNGDPVEPHRQVNREFLSGWRYSANKSKELGEKTYYPRQFDVDRAVWRGFDSLLVDVDDSSQRNGGYVPPVINWLNHVVDQEIVDLDAAISIHIFGLRYDTQASVVGASIDDRIALRIVNFGLNGSRHQAIFGARTAEVIARAVGDLARDLSVAAGGDGSGESASARIGFLSAIDGPYRRWLMQVGVGAEDVVRSQWHRSVSTVAAVIAHDLIVQSGRPAFVGRRVTDSSGRERWIDSAVAERHFRATLRRELPGAFEPTGKEHL